MKNAILLTWNPERGKPMNLCDGMKSTTAGRAVFSGWSTGSSKNIEPGTRCFLMRQKSEPRGIVASGYIVTRPEPAPGYAKRHDAMIVFTMILDTDSDVDAVISFDELMSDQNMAATNWLTAGGGIRIKPESLEVLEQSWSALLGDQGLVEVDGIMDAWIDEGKVRLDSNEHDELGEIYVDVDDTSDEESEEQDEGENERDATLEDLRQLIREEVALAFEQADIQGIINLSFHEAIKDATKGGIFTKIEIALRLRGLEKKVGAIERTVTKLLK